MGWQEEILQREAGVGALLQFRRNASVASA